ncbi:MAG: hypothetical protein M1818_001609 [Claussenomyces sp. TS43310]|nr:MAG: hypothetical protein M1818_001609 [Claussenomyces sp. TS43310]
MDSKKRKQSAKAPITIIKPQLERRGFSKLPPELRLQIWALSMRPRVVDVICDLETQTFVSPTPAPAILHVFAESRAIGLERYATLQLMCPCQRGRHRARYMYVDPHHDTIYLSCDPDHPVVRLLTQQWYAVQKSFRTLFSRLSPCTCFAFYRPLVDLLFATYRLPSNDFEMLDAPVIPFSEGMRLWFWGDYLGNGDAFAGEVRLVMIDDKYTDMYPPDLYQAPASCVIRGQKRYALPSP